MVQFFKICFFLLIGIASNAQKELGERQEVETHLRFLASDELMGRKTGEPGHWIAARYVAEQFRNYGVKPFESLHNGYYQIVPLADVTAPTRGIFKTGDQVYDQESDLLIRQAGAGKMDGTLTYLPYATPEEITEEVRGKMVLTQLGTSNIIDPLEAFAYSAEKIKNLEKYGATGLVEIYQGRYPWPIVKRFLGGGGLKLDNQEGASITSLVIFEKWEGMVGSLKNGRELKFELDTDGTSKQSMPSPNVVGLIEGKDPSLKNEYLVLSAHLDHVGFSTKNNRAAGQLDSIFNGARDNAMGVTAILAAAKRLSLDPPSRSVILVALTAEEIGLVGSKYFVENPLVPLSQMIFNLNTDGAGYSDMSLVAVMGLNRVGAKEEIEQACSRYGLEAFADPAPEQNLFDRSDNVSFAAKGIPAPTFSPGFKAFDQEIMQHYHQPSDEVDSINFNYVLKFAQAYTLAARLIADKKERPVWEKGDKYEPAFQSLYGKK